MNRCQSHRGPDGSGLFEDPSAAVGLGHVRLAILDLTEAGAQPMYSSDGRFVLVFNGEIYNYRELRRALESRGYDFVSTGDTEVLLKGLIEHGSSFLNKLNGMFALALWDRLERKLLLARDHLGIKPLYYAEPKPGQLLFASEIKALCAHEGLKREANFSAIQQHMAFSHASGSQTALKGVMRLDPGHTLSWGADSPEISVRPFWEMSFGEMMPVDYAAAASELRERLCEATRRQLVSDVPLGAFLSGGIDSSAITAAAVETTGGSFQCYTITYPSSENRLDQFPDDAPYARKVARLLGVKLHEIEIAPKVAELWPRLIYHLDEPLADPAAIACYLISSLSRDNQTKVLLSGQGGDELFCGYPRYMVMRQTNLMSKLPWPIRKGIAWSSVLLPAAREGKIWANVRRVRRVLGDIDQNAETRFLRLCASSSQDAVTGVLSSQMLAELQGERFIDNGQTRMAKRNLSGLERFRERDLSDYLPNQNLLYTDKMGMAVGLEARVPMLDTDLVQWALGLSYKCYLAKGQTKSLLRDAVVGLIPQEIIQRPKTGFGAPYRKWLRYDLNEMWNDLTSERVVRRRGWFDHRALQGIRRLSQTGRRDLYMLQWAVLTIEIWAQQFIDGNPCVQHVMM